MEALVNSLRDREKQMLEQIAQDKQTVENITIQNNELEKTRNETDAEKTTPVDLKYREWIKSFGTGAKN